MTEATLGSLSALLREGYEALRDANSRHILETPQDLRDAISVLLGLTLATIEMLEAPKDN